MLTTEEIARIAGVCRAWRDSEGTYEDEPGFCASADRAKIKKHVRGHLPPGWSDWLGVLTIAHEDDGTTTLTGELPDQAALYGVLTKLRDLGVTLVAVAPEGEPG